MPPEVKMFVLNRRIPAIPAENATIRLKAAYYDAEWLRLKMEDLVRSVVSVDAC